MGGRIVKFGTVIVLLIAIILGSLAAFLGRAYILARAKPELITPQGTTLVVAATPIRFGTELTAENTMEIVWSSTVLPDGVFRTRADLLKDGRRVALAPMQKNETVLSTRITGPGQKASLSALIDIGMRAVTIRVLGEPPVELGAYDRAIRLLDRFGFGP